jgi:fatty acid desaturase
VVARKSDRAEADVPEATENGRVSAEARRLIDRRAHWRPLGLGIVLVLWFGYLLAVPILWARHGLLALALVPTAGIYLFTWLGYARHELWHGYFPHLDNQRWFNVVSYALFADPQVYRSAHASHHKFVHTTDDREFYCSEWATNRSRRRAQFLAELMLGNMAWDAHGFWRLCKAHGSSVVAAGLMATAKRLALLIGVIGLCDLLEPGSRWLCLSTYGLTLWAGAVTTRHNQWIEHLGIFSEGSLAERNLLTRNLSSDGWAGRLINLVNHDDARAHVFHHTEPRVDSRGAPGLVLPHGARTISVTEYGRVLVRYWRAI